MSSSQAPRPVVPHITPAQGWAVVGAGICGVLAFVVSVRVGVGLLAIFLVALGLLRAFGRPEQMFVARSRGFDAVLLTGLGLALAYLVLTAGSFAL